MSLIVNHVTKGYQSEFKCHVVKDVFLDREYHTCYHKYFKIRFNISFIS